MTENADSVKKIEDISFTLIERLSEKKIYFGHQSVGYNIVNGVKDILEQESQFDIRIVETSVGSDFTSSIFAHSSVGRNTDPDSKIREFSANIENGIGEKVDIAFLKLCYVDFDLLTDVEEVFESYKSIMAELSQKYPETAFVHFTVPLITRATGLKTAIKKIIGRPLPGYDDNIVRERYNEKIRKEYSGKEPIFDIALIESTRPDGVRKAFFRYGKKYYALLPEYTNDGGHLNEEGRKIVAEQLLIKLLEVVKESE